MRRRAKSSTARTSTSSSTSVQSGWTDPRSPTSHAGARQRQCQSPAARPCSTSRRRVLAATVRAWLPATRPGPGPCRPVRAARAAPPAAHPRPRPLGGRLCHPHPRRRPTRHRRHLPLRGRRERRHPASRTESLRLVGGPATDRADGAFVEPRGCNRWQSAANRPALETSKTSEIRCHRLPPVA
jgi:hypothetical protein